MRVGHQHQTTAKLPARVSVLQDLAHASAIENNVGTSLAVLRNSATFSSPNLFPAAARALLSVG